MNEGIHLDLDTWIVPGQIRKVNLCRGLGNRYTPAGTERQEARDKKARDCPGPAAKRPKAGLELLVSRGGMTSGTHACTQS